MKKLTKLLVLLLVLVAIISMTACKEGDATPTIKSVTLLIVDIEGEELAKFERETEANYLSDLFVMLANQENSTFAYSSNTSIWGQFVNTITVSTDENWVSVGLFPIAANNQFCAFYHTIDDVNLRDYTVANKTYGDKEYYFAGKGISATPLVDGASYMFTINTY